MHVHLMFSFLKDRLLLDRIESFMILVLKLVEAMSPATERTDGIVCLNRSFGFDVMTLYQRVSYAAKDDALRDSELKFMV